MTPEDRDAAVADLLAAIDDGSLEERSRAKLDPEWEAKYGDASWRAALAQFGIEG